MEPIWYCLQILSYQKTAKQQNKGKMSILSYLKKIFHFLSGRHYSWRPALGMPWHSFFVADFFQDWQTEHDKSH